MGLAALPSALGHFSVTNVILVERSDHSWRLVVVSQVGPGSVAAGAVATSSLAGGFSQTLESITGVSAGDTRSTRLSSLWVVPL